MIKTDGTATARRNLWVFTILCLLGTVVLYASIISSNCGAESAASFLDNVRAFHTSTGC